MIGPEHFHHESFPEIVSHLWNWFKGGSIKEMYCQRLVREGRWERVAMLNWWWFSLTGEEMHCQRVARNEEKPKRNKK